tara:strand:+ start:71 stop:325 length:255 start_codon:yes stop_codon:yes gene_type:complete
MAKKIKKQELEELQGVIGKLNQIKLKIGDVEVQKHQLLHQAAIIESEELKKVQDDLENTYGKVSINVTDGSIDKIKEDEPSKKD